MSVVEDAVYRSKEMEACGRLELLSYMKSRALWVHPKYDWVLFHWCYKGRGGGGT